MRASWTGSICFGQINIPVKLYSATRESRLDLDMLDKRDQARIRFKRVNEKTGKEVPWKCIVKGYNYHGRYIELTDEDLERANARKSKTIAIDTFVEEAEIDPIYYEEPYYLEPAKAGSRAYALLREALKKSGKVGVATFAMRGREHLAAVRVLEDVIVLTRLRFPESLQEPGDLKVPPAGLLFRPSEVRMAVELVDAMTGPLHIEEYHDTYTEALKKTIEAKAEGRALKVEEAEAPPTKARDLMAQLRASLEEKRRKAS